MDAVRPITVKLILIGSSGVGKTSLIRSFCEHTFLDCPISTITPAYVEVSLDIGSGTSVTLQIWDTAGQEQYQSVSQLFYRDAQVAFICFDSLTELRLVDDWAFRLREIVPDCCLLLVATKSDLLDDDGRMALTVEGEERAADLGAEYLLTSAKTGQGGLDAFMKAAKAGAIVAFQRKGAGLRPQPSALPRISQGSVCC
jgi:small GTP-binding protein